MFNSARTLNKIEKLRGPSVDSYDKLIAWLAEMAENDNVELDTSNFVRQLSKVCSDSKHGARDQPIRQNSTSCESHASSGSQRYTKSSRSADDNHSLDPRSIFRHGKTSRQGTFSDDVDEEQDDLKNASMESLYSDSDRDFEFETASVYDAKNGNTAGFKAFLSKPKQFACSSSLGELDRIENSPIENQALLNSRRKSVSLLNLCPPDKAARGNGYEYVDNQPEEDREFPTPDNGSSFLNDKLLDGNIADILFSVEALWGK
ncbi:uncharacterized protein LOC121369707 [Gigantopelta aegis]|uniref:uncharacterized protein LOC121369707 n=1 Tax=Gigantopelta aegis TaxID=1735272 RepID=UPI001B889FF7|nr:uncharacterized protein LOC121369707 [Gigantopelta aegis]